MRHRLPQWVDLDGRPTRLQEIPILLQLASMDLSPSLDKTALREGEAATQAFQRIDGEHRRVILVVRVKVRAMC